MEKIGIFGGSFNPPHIGHIRSAAYAADCLGLTKLLIVPTWQTPGKDAPAATPAQRLEMLRLAVQGIEKAEVSNLEISAGRECFTYDTVRLIQGQYPGAEIYLLLGADMFLKFRQWRFASELLSCVTLAALRRGEKKEAALLESETRELMALGGKVMTDAFGLVALVAMMPLITVQVMGAIYVVKSRRAENEPALPDFGDNEIIELWEAC